MLELLAQSHWADRVGWVLVHSLWQFALVALLAAVLQRALARRSANTRYRALLAVMVVMVAAPAATWLSPWSADATAPLGPIENPAAASLSPLLGSPTYRGDATATTAAATDLDVEEGWETAPGSQHFESAAIRTGSLWAPVQRCVQPWLPQIVLVWLGGVMVAALRPLSSGYTVRRLRTVGASPAPDAAQALLRRAAKRLKVARAVALLQSTLVRMPVVVGYLRPAILLPVCLLTGLPEAQLEMILAHELAHIRRHDYLVNLLQVLVETLFFYHPAVWWLSCQIRNERESCCDDTAMDTAASRADYGRALLAIEELRAASTLLSLSARGGSLLDRIRRIAGCEPPPRLVGGAVLGGILASIGIVAALTWGAGPATGKGEPATAAVEDSREHLPAETVVTGQVVDAAGKAIGGARVAAAGNVSAADAKAGEATAPAIPLAAPAKDQAGSGVVTGQVVDAAGKPAAGVEVAPSHWLRARGEGRPVRTDQEGRFWLRLTRPMPQELVIAIDRQRQLRGHTPLPDDRPLEIRLAPTGTLVGRVMAGAEPVAGAQIQATRWEPAAGRRAESQSGYRSHAADMYFAETDVKGRYEIPFVEVGERLSVGFYLEGYAEIEVRSGTVEVAAGQTVEVKPFSVMRTDKSVSGMVVDPEGRPVQGVSVSAHLRSGLPIPRAFPPGPTGADGRFTIRGVPNLPLTIQAYTAPPVDASGIQRVNGASVDADPGQTDVQIVMDPKLARNRRAEATPPAAPTPAQILEKLRARRDSVENLVIEATWEEYANGEPKSWEDGAICRDKQGRIRVRYHHGPGALASADKTGTAWVDETYSGKFTVNAHEDPTRDRLGNARKPGTTPDPANRYRSVMIYNGKWPRDFVGAESHRNPFKCMHEPVISHLSAVLAAGKPVSVAPAQGQSGVYELGYELDVKDDPERLRHRVLVDAGKGWVITRHEQFFANGKSARLSTCDYRRGDDGWWLPTLGQFRYLWGGQVPTLDWRFKVGRVAVNDPRFDPGIFQPEMEAFPLGELIESVAGIVVDPDGHPVEGASVRADLHRGSSLLMAFAWQPTGKDGRFAIDGLPKGPIPMMAYVEPPADSKDRGMRFPVRLTAQAGDKDLRIVLDPKLVRGK